MFVIKKTQLEAFRVPVRKKNREQLLANLSSATPNKVFEETDKIVVENKQGYTSVFHYSDKNLPFAYSKPSGTRYQFEYDEEDRLSKLTFPGNEYLGLSYADSLVEQIDINGAPLQLKYDAKYRLSEIVHADEKRTSFKYHDGNDVASITNRAGETQSFRSVLKNKKLVHYATDPLGRETVIFTDEMAQAEKIQFADNSTLEVEYDEALDAEMVKLRNGTKRRTYYDEFFAKRMEWEDGNFLEIKVKDLKLVESIENLVGQIKYEYDENGRLVKECFQNEYVLYEYNDEHLKKIRYPSGLEVVYEYNEDGNLGRIRALNYDCRFRYLANTVSEIHYPNGVIEKQKNKIIAGLEESELRNRHGETLCRQQYSYDILGRLVRFQEQGAETKPFDLELMYDDESRLLQAKESMSGRFYYYQYDGKGNLVRAGSENIVVGKMDEVRTLKGSDVLYDGNGNVQEFEDLLKLEYADDNTLKLAHAKSGTWEYWYDGLGRRVAKSDGRETYKYFWSGDKLLSEEHSLNGKSVRRDYIYTDSIVPIAFVEKDEIYWLHKDVRGAVTKVFDNKGQLVWSAVYDTFGNSEISVAKLRQPWRLMGQYFDEETGLHYCLARYYSPVLRSFLSIDPKWYLPGADNYRYAANDPYNRVDPDGNLPGWVKNAAAIGAGIVVGVAVGAAIVAAAPVWAATLVGIVVIGAVTGAVSAGVESILNDAVNENPICLKCAAKAALAGAVAGAILGPVANYLLQPLAKAAGSIIGPLARRAMPVLKKLISSSPKNLPIMPRSAANSAIHEAYKNALRRQMQKPFVSDPKLKKVIDNLYRENAKIGSGSTADAIRYETQTGLKVGGRSHTQKGEDAVRFLEDWLKKNPDAKQGDVAAAENVLLDLKDALNP